MEPKKENWEPKAAEAKMVEQMLNLIKASLKEAF